MKRRVKRKRKRKGFQRNHGGTDLCYGAKCSEDGIFVAKSAFTPAGKRAGMKVA